LRCVREICPTKTGICRCSQGTSGSSTCAATTAARTRGRREFETLEQLIARRADTKALTDVLAL
jgi:hypothetical protein